MNDERPETEERTAGEEHADADPTDAASEDEGRDEDVEVDESDSEPAVGADPDQQVPDEADAGERETAGSGTPGVPPAGRDERRNADGIPPTTTTGDPAKDFRGPTVTDEARDGMDADPALDEPGYGDLGHAEDYKVLRDD